MLQSPIRAAFLYDQPHIFHASAVFFAGRDDIDPRRIDTAMTEKIGELCNVLFHAVKCPRKQVAQIMRKHL